jgi:hypothetical protein
MLALRRRGRTSMELRFSSTSHAESDRYRGGGPQVYGHSMPRTPTVVYGSDAQNQHLCANCESSRRAWPIPWLTSSAIMLRYRKEWESALDKFEIVIAFPSCSTGEANQIAVELQDRITRIVTARGLSGSIEVMVLKDDENHQDFGASGDRFRYPRSHCISQGRS